MSQFVKQFVVIAIIAVWIITVQSAPPSILCGSNEQFVTCGSACVPRCNIELPSICTENCIIGCQCKPGFLRNASEQCVASSDC